MVGPLTGCPLHELASNPNTECCVAHVVNQTADKPYYLFDGYAHLAAGLACGLAGLAAGMAIGIVGDAGVRSVPSALLLICSVRCQGSSLCAPFEVPWLLVSDLMC